MWKRLCLPHMQFSIQIPLVLSHLLHTLRCQTTARHKDSKLCCQSKPSIALQPSDTRAEGSQPQHRPRSAQVRRQIALEHLGPFSKVSLWQPGIEFQRTGHWKHKCRTWAQTCGLLETCHLTKLKIYGYLLILWQSEHWRHQSRKVSQKHAVP